MVPDLVPEVAQQGPVGLAHRDTTPFALRVLRLIRGDRNLAFVMTCEDLRARGVRRISKEFKGEAVRGILGHSRRRKLPPQQAVEQAVLCELNQLPSRKTGWVGQIRNKAVVPAGDAERVIRSGRDEPVARIMRGVSAEKRCSPGEASGDQRSSPAGSN